jgi:hypothetical protein
MPPLTRSVCAVIQRACRPHRKGDQRRDVVDFAEAARLFAPTTDAPHVTSD